MSILIHNCTAVLMDEAGTVLPNAYVVVEGTKIRSVSTQRPWGSFEEQIDGRGNVLMPGFVNAHSHVPMTAMRGYGDGNNLQDWLHNYIFPVEARWDDRAIRACTDLGLAEMIASGVTTIADMYGAAGADREVARLQRRADSGGRLHPRRVHLPPPALAVDGGLRPGARPGYARAHLRDPHRA